MRDVIFDGAAVWLARISPIVLGDELFWASFRGQGRLSSCVPLQLAPLVPRSPGILHFQVWLFGVDAMGHWTANVIFAVEEFRGGGGGRPGANLGNETTPP